MLDLGYLNALQALQFTQKPNNAIELIEAVKWAWNKIDTVILQKVFVSLHLNMISILETWGDNIYDVEHTNKNKLVGDNNLPTTLSVPPNVILMIQSVFGDDWPFEKNGPPTIIGEIKESKRKEKK